MFFFQKRCLLIYNKSGLKCLKLSAQVVESHDGGQGDEEGAPPPMVCYQKIKTWWKSWWEPSFQPGATLAADGGGRGMVLILADSPIYSRRSPVYRRRSRVYRRRSPVNSRRSRVYSRRSRVYSRGSRVYSRRSLFTVGGAHQRGRGTP